MLLTGVRGKETDSEQSIKQKWRRGQRRSEWWLWWWWCKRISGGIHVWWWWWWLGTRIPVVKWQKELGLVWVSHLLSLVSSHNHTDWLLLHCIFLILVTDNQGITPSWKVHVYLHVGCLLPGGVACQLSCSASVICDLSLLLHMYLFYLKISSFYLAFPINQCKMYRQDNDMGCH